MFRDLRKPRIYLLEGQDANQGRVEKERVPAKVAKYFPF